MKKRAPVKIVPLSRPERPTTEISIPVRPQETLETVLKSVAADVAESNINLNDDTIKKLIDMKDVYGSNVLSLNNRGLIFTVIYMLQSMSIDEVVDLFAKKPNDEDTIWDSTIFSKEQKKEYLDADILLNRVKVKVDVGRCKYCTSTQLIVSEMQTRSADEPPKITITCILCNRTQH